MIKFVCISDTHNRHAEIDVPDADIVFHAGDSTGRGSTREITEFCEWYGSLPHKYKIMIAGNHDWGFQTDRETHQKICEDNGIIYLQDDGCEIEGIKIWGSPQTPEFCSWAFNCWRTEKDKERNNLTYGHKYEYIGDFWKLIPEDTDILLTHGPAYDIMDKCPLPVGCEELLKVINRINPKFHIFGHIHCEVGEERHGNTTFINAASLGENYKPNMTISDVRTIEKGE